MGAQKKFSSPTRGAAWVLKTASRLKQRDPVNRLVIARLTQRVGQFRQSPLLCGGEIERRFQNPAISSSPEKSRTALERRRLAALPPVGVGILRAFGRLLRLVGAGGTIMVVG